MSWRAQLEAAGVVRGKTVTPPPAAGDGQRTFTHEQADAYVAVALDKARHTAEGSGFNVELNNAAVSLGHFVPTFYSRAQAEQMLEDVCRTKWPAPDSDDRGTIRSGLNKAPTWVAELAAPTPPRSPSDPGAEPLTEHEREVAKELRRLRANSDAKRLLANERAADEFREPPVWASLTAALAEPDKPIRYLVDQILPAGGNAVLTAQFKAGKTTLVNNLARALADGTPFLGRFPVERPAGRIALWNYEVSPGQYRRWLRDAAIENTDALAVVNLRGHRLDLTTTHGEEWAVRWLTEQEIAVWIVDPYGRALAGADENSNSEVGAFLEALDVIKDRAGVGELVMPAHTGRREADPGDERARGATRLDDWPDARWILTRAKADDTRFFRATGRDVDIEEEALEFDPSTRELRLGGWDRAGMEERRIDQQLVPKVVEVVRAKPGISATDLRGEVPGDTGEVGKAIKRATREGGPVVVVKVGKTSEHHIRQMREAA